MMSALWLLAGVIVGGVILYFAMPEEF